MIRMFKYLKSAWAAVLLTIAFLVVQAVCDLALPTYTARIVDTGIQQQGIENPSPTVIRESEMDILSLFMTTAEKEAWVTPNYTLLPVQSGTKYPLQAQEALYEQNKVSADVQENLNTVFTRAYLLKALFSGEMPESLTSDTMPDMAGMFPMENMSLEAVFAMPDEARNQMIVTVDEMLTNLPESILSQIAIPMAAAEYEAVGLDLASMQSSYIWSAGLAMLGIALAGMAAAVIVGFFGARIAASLGRTLRGKVFGRVLSFSQAEMDQFSTASLITRSTNDIQQVQTIMVFLMRIVFYAPIMAFGGVLKVLNTNLSMAWVLALAVGLIIAIVLVLYVFAMPRFKKLQSLIDQLNRVTREILSGLPVIRAFSTQKREAERFDEANKNLNRTQLFVNRLMSGMMPLMMLVMNGITLLIMWTGSKGIDSGVMQVGDMMAFIQYTMQIIMSFLMISMMSVMLPRASVAARRIDEVISTEPTIADPASPVAFNGTEKGVLAFNNVSFHYPGAEEPTLSHISFTALPGQTTAILGGTGSGKSTLVQLIPRFYDATEGSITLDGVDVRDATQHDLRSRIGYVPQKGNLFSGTIESNIAYGAPDASQEIIDMAAEIAQAKDFIEAKPGGYDSPVAQGGSNVSGGQKQRLSIARAIAVQPEVYVFDDSFSALDFKTDVALRAALRAKVKDSTVIIVAQRISTILHAEQIIVLDEGKIVGKGTHAELMDSCEVYQQIALSQLSKEELEHGK